MISQFKKEPFINRLKDTLFLLKNSLTVIGKDEDIIKPYLRMAIFSFVLTSLLFGAVLGVATGEYMGTGILIFLLVVFFLNPFRYFYDVRQKACQSWIVYNTIVGKNISYLDAHQHTQASKPQLRIIAIIDIGMAYLRMQKSKNDGGIVAVVMILFFRFLEEVWDLLSHYMLPAVVIEQKQLREVTPQLKKLRKNVPATLAGVFGIDFVGNVLGSILFPLYMVFLALSVGVGTLLVSSFPSTAVSPFDITFSWVPVAIVMYIIAVLGGILKKFVESVKVIYFTVFYTTLTRPGKIKGTMKKELTHYLKMNK
jgi:hypothetical protein